MPEDRADDRETPVNELLLTENALEVLQDVERAYSVGEHWAKVREVFDPFTDLRPAKVFRSHLAKIGDYVVEPDVAYRAALDLLLGGLSALHIGGLGAVPERSYSETGRVKILFLLSEPAICQYYEEHYPFAPPILVRPTTKSALPNAYREAWTGELTDDRFSSLYRQFLHLDARFIADEVIGDFIALLDDFYVEGEHIEDLGWALEKPKHLKRWLKEDPDRWQLLEAMESFFEFALDLDAFLQRAELPVLRGHAWLHFAYWFGSGGKRMLEVATWLADAAIKVQGSESDETAAAVIAALDRLRDPDVYATGVLALVGDELRPWLKSSGVGRRWTAADRPLP